MTDNTADQAAVTDTLFPLRVKFGPADTQEIPFEWAEKGLCWLFENRRQTFADMMLDVMGTGFSTGNARKNAVKGGSNGH
jgi:hypothetical protein